MISVEKNRSVGLLNRPVSKEEKAVIPQARIKEKTDEFASIYLDLKEGAFSLSKHRERGEKLGDKPPTAEFKEIREKVQCSSTAQESALCPDTPKIGSRYNRRVIRSNC